MNRRETLKTLILASAAPSFIGTVGCASYTNNAVKPLTWVNISSDYSYGRTDVEKAHDQNLFKESYFRYPQLITIDALCEIIPTNEHS